ncbi:unnamed protein product [Prunus armeniaca]|uniref:SHSP domain-containing protein n=1 Tax=Prunus armeniaca TaxID=36596 RepID=A0A6J5TXG6_PRUAR|nr:unnamed protein product [Prunus armeniaca]
MSRVADSSTFNGDFATAVNHLLKCPRNHRQVHVTVEEENTLVIRRNGKRKREDGEEEGCKYLRLERRAPQNLLGKFRLPQNANGGAISAKGENGVLTVVVGKLPPPPKPKTVEVSISWSRLTLAYLRP